VSTVALDVETAGGASGRGEPTKLAVLVNGLADPVRTRVVADCGVGRIDKDDLIEFEGRVLSNPIRVQDTETREAAAGTLLGNSAEGAGVLNADEVLVLGLAANKMGLTTATTTANTDAIDDVTLLRLVAKTAGLIRASGVRAASDHGELTELPAANTEKEAHHIGLLLAPELLKVKVGTH